MVRHQGSHDRLGESIYSRCRKWLPLSGEELSPFQSTGAVPG